MVDVRVINTVRVRPRGERYHSGVSIAQVGILYHNVTRAIRPTVNCAEAAPRISGVLGFDAIKGDVADCVIDVYPLCPCADFNQLARRVIAQYNMSGVIKRELPGTRTRTARNLLELH